MAVMGAAGGAVVWVGAAAVLGLGAAAQLLSAELLPVPGGPRWFQDLLRLLLGAASVVCGRPGCWGPSWSPALRKRPRVLGEAAAGAGCGGRVLVPPLGGILCLGEAGSCRAVRGHASWGRSRPGALFLCSLPRLHFSHRCRSVLRLPISCAHPAQPLAPPRGRGGAVPLFPGALKRGRVQASPAGSPSRPQCAELRVAPPDTHSGTCSRSCAAPWEPPDPSRSPHGLAP